MILHFQDQGQDEGEVQIKVPKVKDEYQTERFIVLLLVLQLSMFMVSICTMKVLDSLTHFQRQNFRLVHIETNCRRHCKVHLKWKISTM